jgi:hypothetical protein
VSAALALVPVPVCGYTLDAGRDNAGAVWVSVRAVCEVLSLDFSTQLQKLKAKCWGGVGLIPIPSAGGVQDVACLPLRALPMWLATIQTSRVRPEARATLERFQCEAADVLARHFLGEVEAPRPPPVVWADGTPQQLAELRARVERLEAGAVEGQQERAAIRAVLVAEQLLLPLGAAPAEPREPREPTPLDRLLVAWDGVARSLLGADHRGITAAEAVEHMRLDHMLAPQALRASLEELDGGALVSTVRLGYLLRRYANRPSGGLVLKPTKSHGERRWAVVPARPRAVRGAA